MKPFNNLELTNKKMLIFLMHLAFWILIFLWPVLSLENISNSPHLINRNWLSTSSILVIFYLNYFIIVDCFFLKKKKVQFYFINLLLIAIFFFLIKLFLNFNIFNPTNNGLRMREVRTGSMSSFQLIFPMILSIGMCAGLKINTQWVKNKITLQDVKQHQLATEIKYLRSQIQPHFLFNSLNNVYSLIDSSPDLAKTSIHDLSKMMRYLLHESTVLKVPLAKEIEFIERYINLMQLRTTSNFTLNRNFPIINQPIQVAPLLFISFIENAFKHGIDPYQPSYISISMTTKGNEILYSVINSSFPQKEKNTDSGIGLKNLKNRLKILYPNNFELFNEEKNGVYKATLKLKYKNYV